MVSIWNWARENAFFRRGERAGFSFGFVLSFLEIL